MSAALRSHRSSTIGLLVAGTVMGCADAQERGAPEVQAGGQGGCEVSGPRPHSALWGSFGSKLTIAVPENGQPPPGTTLGRRLPSGEIYAKVLWRGDAVLADGRLRVDGRRRDASTRPMRAEVTEGNAGFVPSALRFPSAGCWEITARGTWTQVTYVVRVNI